jgi:hypothetical protein
MKILFRLIKDNVFVEQIKHLSVKYVTLKLLNQKLDVIEQV